MHTVCATFKWFRISAFPKVKNQQLMEITSSWNNQTTICQLMLDSCRLESQTHRTHCGYFIHSFAIDLVFLLEKRATNITRIWHALWWKPLQIQRLQKYLGNSRIIGFWQQTIRQRCKAQVQAQDWPTKETSGFKGNNFFCQSAIKQVMLLKKKYLKAMIVVIDFEITFDIKHKKSITSYHIKS